jgi:hypothetical protein
MATRAQSNPVDLQKLLTAAAVLEVKAVNAGIEYWQLWMNQAAKLSGIASDTLTSIGNDKASFSETAKRLNEFGRQNAEAFTDLARRLSERYFDELDRLAKSLRAEGSAEPRSKRGGKSAAGKRSASAA